MKRVQRIGASIGLCTTLLLGACADGTGADSNGTGGAAPPKTATASVAEAASHSPTTIAPKNPLCGKASFAEVSAVVGGHFDKVDVIDEPDLDYVECNFLDSRDLYAGLTIHFVSTAKLVATKSKWQTAAAYFDEWSRGGDPVSGLGERATWTELPAGLLVLASDQALQFSASKSDLSDPSVRARFETLARAVVSRIP